MILDKISEIGELLGLEHRDIQNLLSERPIVNITNKTVTPCSPMNTYKQDGTWYGTMSINDF